eukprot:3416918-Amphidinium_carterae.1
MALLGKVEPSDDVVVGGGVAALDGALARLGSISPLETQSSDSKVCALLFQRVWGSLYKPEETRGAWKKKTCSTFRSNESCEPRTPQTP